MSIFDLPKHTTYQELKVEDLGRGLYVDLHQLLDILNKRAILSLRTAGTVGAETRIADFERGRFDELTQLYKALHEHLPKA